MMEHFYQHFPPEQCGFWYKPAYEKLFAGLPNDRPSVWVEVGVFHGQALCWLGVEVVNSRKPVTVYAVDDFRGWPGVAQGDTLWQSFLTHTKPISQLLCDQFEIARFDSAIASSLFWTGVCDVVWLDADHREAAVRADIASWWPKVRLGGWLGGDDWALNENGCYGDVKRAVEASFPKEQIQLIDGERHGQPWPSWLVQKTA